MIACTRCRRGDFVALAIWLVTWAAAGSATAQDGGMAEPPRPSDVVPAAEPAPAPAAIEGESSAPAAAVADESAPNLSDAELAALLAAPPDLDAASESPSLHLYGFGDFLLMKSFQKVQYGAYPPKTVVMTVGNVNLYAAADLTHGFSSLLEVRFTYLPNGSLDPISRQNVSTTVLDYADWNRQVQWGGIVLERFHLDYSYHGLLNLRVGAWLTPYGIWNVDHGSPTVIPVVKPYVIGEQLFPTRQTGFQLHGSQLVGRVTLGYGVTLSNGRGDVQQLDLDENKAVGGRLFLSYSADTTLTLGATVYYGRATRAQRLTVVPGDPPMLVGDSDDSFKELSFAGDLLWEWRALRVQSELISQQVRYDDDSRKFATGFGTPSGFIPDHTAWGAYVLLAYRLPWLNVMPFAVLENFDRGYARKQLLVLGGNSVNVFAVRGGLNIRPIPTVVLKLQYSYILFPGVEPSTKLPNFSCQVAWAF